MIRFASDCRMDREFQILQTVKSITNVDATSDLTLSVLRTKLSTWRQINVEFQVQSTVETAVFQTETHNLMR